MAFWKKTTAPVPPTLPGLTLLRARFADMPGFLAKTAAELGPMVRFKSVTGNIYFTSNPAGIEEVLVSKASAFEKGRGTKLLMNLLGKGLLTAEPPDHLVHRRLVQPAFHRKRIADYARVMVARSEAMVEPWRDGEVIDVDHAMNRLALEIAAEALFGASMEDAEMTQLSAELNSAMKGFPFLMIPLSEYWGLLPLPIMVRFRRSKAKLDAIVNRMVREHRADVNDRGDVMSMLISARDDEKRGGMDDAQVRDEAMTILLAGHETTANALAWTFYLLQRHPEVERKLHAHLDAVLQGRTPEMDDVPKLDYVRALLAEVMRLYPPAWVTARRATSDVEIDGWRVKKGEIALVSQYVTHRDPRFWTDPDRFDPDRFMDRTPSPKYSYFPFGGGTRLCIGESFAWTEGILAIAAIASRVALESMGDPDVSTLPLVTLRPRSQIRARVRERAPATPQTALA